MTGHSEIGLNRPERSRVDRNKSDLGALASNPKMQHALAAVQVLHLEATQLFTADAVVKQGRENRTIADALESVRRRRFQQLAGLTIAKRRRAAFVAIGHWPLDAVDRIAGHGVAVAKVIE